MLVQDNVQALTNTIVNLVLFSSIPFLWWLLLHRKKEKLFSWLGIKRPAFKNYRALFLLFGLFLLILIGSNFFLILEPSENAVSQYRGMGASAIFRGLLFGIIQTGASEEIFFRGFLAKRFIKVLGFVAGNILQAALFGLLHVALLLLAIASFDLLQVCLLFLVPFLGGLLFGYVNERQAGGSIIPSWCMHSAGNVITSIIAMFSV